MTKLTAVALTLPLLFIPPAISAETLLAGLERILKDHPLMRTTDGDVAAAREQVNVERSGWYPKLNAKASAGQQHVSRAVGAGGNFDPTELTLGVNQLIWDFGATNAGIDRADKTVNKELAEQTLQRSNLILAGLDAHLKLLRAQQVLDFAKQSEGNIKKQAQLENTRIESGKGYTTDLLQAKTQLAGAQARRVTANGNLETAISRYRAVFGDANAVTGKLERISEPAAALPKSLEEALGQVQKDNPDVLAAGARAELKTAERDAIKAREWAPRIDLVAEASNKHDYDGVQGKRDDTKALVQASWNFETGGRATHATDAATHSASAEMEKARYTALQALEETRNAWTDLAAAREKAAFLTDQVDIAKQFLNLARRERELGRRSLLDVLQGETNLINAQSDLAAAQTDVVLFSFRLLRATGRLDINQVAVVK